MTKKEQLFNLLFDEGDTICICPYKEHPGKFITLSEISINSGQLYAINPMSGGRKNSNVTKFKNFLVEFDDIPLNDQIQYAKDVGLPYSAIVYSGNKSYHFLISLENPLKDLGEYNYFSNYIHNIIVKSDPATKKACQLSRYPGVRRSETGKYQEIIEVKKRISNSDIIYWFEEHPECIPPSQRSSQQVDTKDRKSIVEVLNWYVRDFLKSDYNNGARTYVRCPICADEGRDLSEDNMCITHESMFFGCFQNPKHNSDQLSRIYSLRREMLISE